MGGFEKKNIFKGINIIRETQQYIMQLFKINIYCQVTMRFFEISKLQSLKKKNYCQTLRVRNIYLITFNKLLKFQLNRCKIREMACELLYHGYGFLL